MKVRFFTINFVVGIFVGQEAGRLIQGSRILEGFIVICLGVFVLGLRSLEFRTRLMADARQNNE